MLLVQRLQFEDYFYGVWVFEHWGAPEHFLRSVTKTDLHFLRNTWVEIGEDWVEKVVRRQESGG